MSYYDGVNYPNYSNSVRPKKKILFWALLHYYTDVVITHTKSEERKL